MFSHIDDHAMQYGYVAGEHFQKIRQSRNSALFKDGERGVGSVGGIK